VVAVSIIKRLETSDIASLTANQTANLTVDQISALTTAQVQALTIAQIPHLTTDQVRALSNSQISKLETADIAALTTTQFSALSYDQIQSLTTAQIAAITGPQAAHLTAEQISAFTTVQIKAFEITDLAMFGSNQYLALSSEQLDAMSVAQINTLMTISGNSVTPLVLDLNGDGVRTVSIDAGVRFDISATGNSVAVGWASTHDGFLTFDRNQDGTINDGSELFGSATLLADGSRAADGFAALKALDSDLNGVINAMDEHYQDLTVWTDSNQDGISQATELTSLVSLGIKQLDTAAITDDRTDNGNWIGLSGSYTLDSGVTRELADVWLSMNDGPVNRIDLALIDPNGIPAGVLAHLDLAGNGRMDIVSVSADAVGRLGELQALDSPDATDADRCRRC